MTAGGVAVAESASAVVAVAETAPASASRVTVAAVATVAGAWPLPLGLGRDLRLSTQATILRFSPSGLRVSIYPSQSHKTIRPRERQIYFIRMTLMV